MISATDLPSRASSSSSAVIRAVASGTLSFSPRSLRALATWAATKISQLVAFLR